MAKLEFTNKASAEEEQATEKKKVNKRKLLVKAGAGVLIAAVVLLVVFFTFFRVKTIRVKGGSRYANEEIIANSEIPLGKNICFLKLDEAAQNIEQNLPYCTDVTFKKKFPSTIEIHVSDAEAKYSVILDKNLFGVTDGDMKLLEITSDYYTDTILVIGHSIGTAFNPGQTLQFSEDAGEDKIRIGLSDVSQAVKETEAAGIEAINIEDPDNIYLIYEDRIIVKVGSTNDILKKITLAQKALEEENKLSSSQYGELDVKEIKKAIFCPKDHKDMAELLDYDESIKPVDEQVTVEGEEISEDENAQENENSDENNYDEDDE